MGKFEIKTIFYSRCNVRRICLICADLCPAENTESLKTGNDSCVQNAKWVNIHMSLTNTLWNVPTLVVITKIFAVCMSSWINHQKTDFGGVYSERVNLETKHLPIGKYEVTALPS